MKCPRCYERLIPVTKDTMGQILECECRVRVIVPYGDVLPEIQMDRSEQQK